MAQLLTLSEVQQGSFKVPFVDLLPLEESGESLRLIRLPGRATDALIQIELQPRYGQCCITQTEAKSLLLAVYTLCGMSQEEAEKEVERKLSSQNTKRGDKPGGGKKKAD